MLFRRGHVPTLKSKDDEEENLPNRPTTQIAVAEKGAKNIEDVPSSIQKQTAIFHWDSVNYDIKIKGEPRRLLNEVDGWVKPGTLTALMVCCSPPGYVLNEPETNRIKPGSLRSR